MVQRGHNLRAVFVEPADYRYYLDNLKTCKRIFDVSVYAYCLMTNHVHLVLVPESESYGISGLMRRLSARQGRYVNRLEGRRGTLWCGRFRSSIVDSNAYLLACLRYIELNPVRAGLVRDPGAYPWSSYSERMGLAATGLLDPDPAMEGLGRDYVQRRRAYREYAVGEVNESEQALIRESVRRNQVTGTPAFAEEIQRRTGLRILRRGPGRPKGRK